MKFSGNKSLLTLGVVLLACVSSCSNWTKQNIIESQKRGDEIVAAIEKYYVENDKYPAKLEDLVPAYLAKMAPPVAGNGKWIYVNEGSKGYFLGFGGDDPDADPISYFSYSLKEWVMDTR